MGKLFRDLEFAGLNYPSIMISYLVDINSAVIISEINCSF